MTQNLMGATSALPQVLVSQQLAATETTQYTCPAASAAKIARAVLTNTSGSAVTVSVSMVKSGGTAGAANRVIAPYTLIAGDSIIVDELQGNFLGPGDFVSTLAGTASAVTLVMSGVVFA
ncbi:hypothetical protein [Gordonia sp. N1V]|uniref:hypothetical protein n=1 Tax=Gordonia sp. N1V TaxID=3034163 RepID=UPI0023E1A085|nr:hypothetical protein [Gordonia sp. N1V]MDF3280501.1 hypothetical protein [Gordonia sp. N1V]